MSTITQPNLVEEPKIEDHKFAFSLVTFSRIFVGVLFIISGLIKANDTIGFAYKLEEYFEVFATDLSFSTLLVQACHFLKSIAWEQAFFLCVLEIALGIFLLLGVFRTFTVWFLLALILFFTALTWYSWTFEKVTDCGCFGDALKLTPFGSFMKDLILLFFISILVWGKVWIRPIFSQGLTYGILTLGILGSIVFPYLTYNHLPYKDFRPYAIGNNLIEKMYDDVPDSVALMYVYKNKSTQEIKELEPKALEALLKDPNWEFVERKETILKKGQVAGVHDFNIVSATTGRDVTNQLLLNPNTTALIVMYDLDKANTSVQAELNTLAQELTQKGMPVLALTSASSDRIASFKKANNSNLDFYTVDGTTLKTMIRSNPGLMLIKNAVVQDMWHHNDLPTTEALLAKYPVTKEPQPLIFVEEIPQIDPNDRKNVIQTYKERILTPNFEILDADGADYSTEFLRDSLPTLVLIHPDYFKQNSASIEPLLVGFTDLGLYATVLVDDFANHSVPSTSNYSVNYDILQAFLRSNVKGILMQKGKILETWTTLPSFETLRSKYNLKPVILE